MLRFGVIAYSRIDQEAPGSEVCCQIIVVDSVATIVINCVVNFIILSRRRRLRRHWIESRRGLVQVVADFILTSA